METPQQEQSAMDRLTARIAAGPREKPAPQSGEKSALPGFVRAETPPADAPPASALERLSQRIADRESGNAPPTSAEGYRFDGLEGVEPIHVDAFKSIAKEAGLSQRQATTVLSKYREHVENHTKGQTERTRQATEANHKAIAGELELEWGTEYASNSKAVLEFTKGLSDTQFHSLVQRLLLQETRRGNA